MGDQLINTFSMHCKNCDARWEGDGFGKLESEYRAIVFEQEGAWELRLKEREDQKRALLVLKKIESLDMHMLRDIKNLFPYFYEGTKAEMEFISYWLSQKNIKHELVKKA